MVRVTAPGGEVEEDPLAPEAGDSPQQPQGQGQGPPPVPLPRPGGRPDFGDKIRRLLKRRADSLQRTRFDDRGRVLQPGISDPLEAFALAMEELPKFAASEGGMDKILAYVDGGPLPQHWLPYGETDDGTVLPAKSRETLQAEMAEIRAQTTRNAMTQAAGETLGPVGGAAAMAAFDYVVTPLGEVLPAFGQAFADVYAGLTGAKERADVKATLHSWIEGLAPGEQRPEGMSFEERAKQLRFDLDARYKLSSGGAQGAQDAGRLAGELLSYLWGGGVKTGVSLTGKALGKVGLGGTVNAITRVAALPHHIMVAGGKIGGAIGSKLGGKVAGALGQGMGAFAALKGVTARGEGVDEEGLPTADAAPSIVDRLKGAGIGALEGIPIAVAGLVAKHVYHGMFKTAYKALGKTEQEQMAALTKWAEQKGIKGRLAKESDTDYATRLSNAFVDAGMPGAPPMRLKKAKAYAIMGGIEALGFSPMDADFWSDLIDGIWAGDGDKIAKSLAKFVGNSLVLGASKMPLNQLPPWQRQQADPHGELLKPPEQAPEPEGTGAFEVGPRANEGVTQKANLERIALREAHEQAGKEGEPDFGERTDAELAAAWDARQAATPPEAAPAAPEAPQGGLAGQVRTELEGEPAQGVDPRTLRAEPEAQRSAATGTTMPTEPMPLRRLGWVEVMPQRSSDAGRIEAERAETEQAEQRMEGEGGRTFELPGTEMSYTVKGDTATPNKELARALDVEFGAAIGRRQFEAAIEEASLASALETKADAAGTEISVADGVIKAVAGPEGEAGVMRTVRMGQKLESPLQPEPEWKPVDEFTAKNQPDVLTERQQVASQVLSEALGNVELSDKQRVMLSNIAKVLDTVSERSDPSVKEALDALPQLLERLGQNPSPEAVDASLKALAEILTTKSPELALGDMQQREVEQTLRDQLDIERMEGEGGPALPEPEAGPTSQAMGGVRKIRQSPGESGAVEVATPEQAERIRAAGKMAREAVTTAVQQVLTQPVRSIARGIAAVLDTPPFRWWSLAPIEKTRQVEPEIGARGFAAEANTREFEGQYQPIAAEIPSTRIREGERMFWQERTASGARVGFQASHAYKDADLGQLLGVDPSTAPAKLKQALGPWNRLTRLIREHAAALGMHVQGRWTPEGELAEITPEASRDVMTRQFTQVARDALLHASGRVYRGLVEGIAKVNNMTVEAVEQVFKQDGWTDAAGVRRRDPLERVRKFKYMPDHIELADGAIHRILETRPLHHAKAMLKGAAMRLGTVKEFGPDDPLPDQTTADLVGRLTGERLPVAYLKIIEQAKPANRETVATMLRTLMGMPTSRLSPDVEIGGAYHRIGQVLSGLNDLGAALRMTATSWQQNISEPFGTARALLGGRRMDRAHGKTAAEFAEGRWQDAMTERQKAGGFEMALPEWTLGGEPGTIESMLTAMRIGRQGAMLPFDATQLLNDVAIHRGLFDAVDGWRQGTRDAGDAQALQTLFGFRPAEAQQIVEGKAKPELYRQIELNGLARITNRGELPVNKSAFARSRHGLAKAVKFTGFFQDQVAKLRQAAINLRDAETPEQQRSAAAGLAKMVGWNLGAYFVGQSIIKASSGIGELMGFWDETIEDVQTPGGAAKTAAAAVVGTLLGPVGSVLGGGISAALGLGGAGDREKADVVDSITNLVPAVGSAMHLWEFGDAMLHNLAGTAPASDSRYSGKTPLQQVGYFLGSQVAAVRWAENGPFGLGLTLLGTDPQLEGALRASRRISNKLGIESEFTTSTDAAFTDTLRKAVVQLKGDESPAEVADAIRDALPDKEDSSIARSLLARRALAGPAWEELDEAQQESKLRSLGEKRVELLRGYDAVLERTARYFQRFGRRRRRRT